MRKSEAHEALTAAVKKHFPSDVAEALLRNLDRDGALIRLITKDEDLDKTALDGRVAAIAANTDGSTKDWLVEEAGNPGGWLYKQMDQWW